MIENNNYESKTNQRAVKRLFDLLLAPIILLFSFPLLIISIMVIKIKSPEGSVIYKQVRSGYKSKLFTMYKLRTMTNERDSDGNLLEDKKRLKNWGKVIRKIGLDEIPQMINVIKFEMSLIGPRPILPSYVERLDNYQLRRQDALPGISGWQTVNEWKTYSWDKSFEYDNYYIDNFSLWLDAKIFFKTLKMVLLMYRTNEDYRPTFDEYYNNK